MVEMLRGRGFLRTFGKSLPQLSFGGFLGICISFFIRFEIFVAQDPVYLKIEDTLHSGD